MIQATLATSGYQTTFTNGTASAQADMPKLKGGEGNGFGPHELLEAALASCMAITIRKHALERQYAIDSIHCEVNLDRSQTGMVIYQCSIKLTGNITQEIQAELFELASLCPVAKTLTGVVTISKVKAE